MLAEHLWAQVPLAHFCSPQGVLPKHQLRSLSHLILSLVLATQNDEIQTRSIVDAMKTILEALQRIW